MCLWGGFKNQFAKQRKITPMIVSLDHITSRRWFSFEMCINFASVTQNGASLLSPEPRIHLLL